MQQILRCLMILCCVCVLSWKLVFRCCRQQLETPYSGAGAGTMKWTFSTHTPRRGACRRLGWEHDFTWVPFVCVTGSVGNHGLRSCCCVQGPVPTPRGCHASALLGNKGYISGGAVSRPHSVEYINFIYSWRDIFTLLLIGNKENVYFRQWCASSFCGVGLGKVLFLLKHPFPVMMWLCLHAQSKIRTGSCVDDWSAPSPDLDPVNWITTQQASKSRAKPQI